MKGETEKLCAGYDIKGDLETALVILASKYPAIWEMEVSWPKQVRRWGRSFCEVYPMADTMERKERINLILNFVKEELAVKKRII